MQMCVAHGSQELRGEEEGAFDSLEVAHSLEVGSVFQHPRHPFEGMGKLGSTPA